jgi:hypothetical protein
MITTMFITNAQYKKNEHDVVVCISANIDGKNYHVPLNPANRHYAEILRQVEAGTLTIQEASD